MLQLVYFTIWHHVLLYRTIHQSICTAPCETYVSFWWSVVQVHDALFQENLNKQ